MKPCDLTPRVGGINMTKKPQNLLSEISQQTQNLGKGGHNCSNLTQSQMLLEAKATHT